MKKQRVIRIYTIILTVIFTLSGGMTVFAEQSQTINNDEEMSHYVEPESVITVAGKNICNKLI